MDARLGEPGDLSPAPRVEQVVAVAGRTAVFAGGQTVSSPLAAVDIFDVATDAWTTSSMPTPRVRTGDQRAAVVGSKVLIAGGRDLVPTVVVYDTATGAWSSAPLADGRANVPIVVGSTVLFTSGPADTVGGTDAFTACDDRTDRWSSGTRPLNRFARAVAVADRWAVLWSSAPFLTSPGDDQVEVYDAETGAWTVHRLPSGGGAGMGAAVRGTTVYFARGSARRPTAYDPYRAVLVDAVEALDLATGTWSRLPLSAPRGGPVVVVAGGELLVAGGHAELKRERGLSALVDVSDLGDVSRRPGRPRGLRAGS